LSERIDEIEVYAVGGSSKAAKIQDALTDNPRVTTINSICFLDGDAAEQVNIKKRIYKLPGAKPEDVIFEGVFADLDNRIEQLTLACQRSPDRQAEVRKAIRSANRTNVDRHTVFNLIAERLGSLPKDVVEGAFLLIWTQGHSEEADQILEPVIAALTEADHVDKPAQR
jgi:hypothetical protein